ncbi:MAG: deoxyribonuclease IV [Candidatus Pacebacteria bacterium]|nr:deoxyribonuclease IV [Candidatus Paceibacterota bacterium]
MIRLGGHVSSSGGLLKALDRACAIGANTIQLFGASPVQWKAAIPEEREAREFIAKARTLDIHPIFLHAPYLINLASPKENLAALSRTLLEKHLRIAHVLAARGVIFHIGSQGERAHEEVENMVVDALSRILDSVEGDSMLIIENSAGAGNLIGDTLEEIGSIMGRIKSSRVGFCFDTAHAYEAGVIVDYSKKGVDQLLSRIDKYIGVKRLVAVHLNDSKTPAQSNKDRHENIGDGTIGYEGIGAFVRNDYIKKLPLLLEVPGIKNEGPDKENIDRVKKLMVH